MAPGSAPLALKATAFVSILAVLVVPSLGRCGHSPPPPPPAAASTPPPPAPLPQTPAPAPGPGPTISCDDCSSQCGTQCKASIASKCSDACDHVPVNCDDGCKAIAIERCKDYRDCYKAGTCDCKDEQGDTGCLHGCSPMPCMTCESAQERNCYEDCSKQCSAPYCMHTQSPEN